jgi:hypothetical protein
MIQACINEGMRYFMTLARIISSAYYLPCRINTCVFYSTVCPCKIKIYSHHRGHDAAVGRLRRVRRAHGGLPRRRQEHREAVPLLCSPPPPHAHTRTWSHARIVPRSVRTCVCACVCVCTASLLTPHPPTHQPPHTHLVARSHRPRGVRARERARARACACTDSLLAPSSSPPAHPLTPMT